MPKFTKVDEHTIKITVENASDVPLFQIVENKVRLLNEKKQIESALKHIEEILDNAKKLGITVKYPPKKTKPNNLYPKVTK